MGSTSVEKTEDELHNENDEILREQHDNGEASRSSRASQRCHLRSSRHLPHLHSLLLGFQTSLAHNFRRTLTEMASEGGGKSFARRDRLREIEVKVQKWWEEKDVFTSEPGDKPPQPGAGMANAGNLKKAHDLFDQLPLRESLPKRDVNVHKPFDEMLERDVQELFSIMREKTTPSSFPSSKNSCSLVHVYPRSIPSFVPISNHKDSAVSRSPIFMTEEHNNLASSSTRLGWKPTSDSFTFGSFRSKGALSAPGLRTNGLHQRPFLQRTLSKWLLEIISPLLPIILRNGEDLRHHLLVVNSLVEIFPSSSASPFSPPSISNFTGTQFSSYAHRDGK
ncbi:hypothetical protein SESBI_40876 [Sesbania bispinosa]|nr:hypothetical protein SESBI_40876 [Sesbania bispinosa]